MSWVMVKSSSLRSRSFWYKAVGGWSGESADVGKYAGAGGVLSGALVAMLEGMWFISLYGSGTTTGCSYSTQYFSICHSELQVVLRR